jgi:hypothetical protein
MYPVMQMLDDSSKSGDGTGRTPGEPKAITAVLSGIRPR